MKSPIIGLLGTVLITYLAIHFTKVHTMIYVNNVGLLVVLGGTLCASTITFGLQDLFRIVAVSVKVFTKSVAPAEKTVEHIVHIAQQLHQSNHDIDRVIKENNLHPYLVDGLKLIQNDFEEEQIAQIMSSSLVERKSKFMHHIEVLKTLAKYPPAFGMIGTVIGLVAILQELGDAGTSQTIGPNMAVALVTTLYGLLLANYIFIPLSDNMLHRLEKDLENRKIIIRGILLMKDKEDPVFIQEMLNAHLNPSKRVNHLINMA